MNKRLLNYLNSKNFFNDNQYGFTKGKNTEGAISNFVEHIFRGFNDNMKTTGIFIDFTKAFDLVNHNILLNKLEFLGVRGNALGWFRTYLENRQQKVKISNSFSSSKTVSIGVPQGSVLSASLFLIFINDLLNLQLKGKMIGFADDIAIRYSENNWQSILIKMRDDFKLIRKWCGNYRIALNATKTNFIKIFFK